MQRVFISSTSKDLRHFREVVKSAILDQGWQPVMMEHFRTDVAPTVEACCQKLRESDLVLLLVAFRRGWVPTVDQGGDGLRSVTVFEVESARRAGVPIRALLARDSWPGNFWENDQKARNSVLDFHAELNLIAKFFTAEGVNPQSGEPEPGREFRSLVRELLLDHREWLQDQAAAARPASRSVADKTFGAEALLPELEEILQRVVVPRADVLRVYRENAPLGWDPPPGERNSVALATGCARSLARAPRTGGSGLFPLLRFASALCPSLSTPDAAALNTWVEAKAVTLGLKDSLRASAPVFKKSKREDIHARYEPPADAPCHLLVQVSPRLCERGTYGVKAWLFGTGEPACLLAGEDSTVRQDLPACMEGLREELILRGVGPDNVWVELLLPRDLLCEDVDQWTVPLEFIDAVPIGVEHRLVVRSLERASRPKAALALQSWWRSVRGDLNLAWQLADAPCGTEGLALWIETDDCGGPALYSTLRDAPKLIGAVLGQPPKTEPVDPRRDVLNTLFAAGVPVALWVRSGDPAAVRAALTSVLAAGTPANLPDRVWRLRKQALRSADAAHLGRHITLLWDDPTRPSPDFEPGARLRPPARSG
jgi:vWA-MoxR associated protein C-terminal domain/Domain of unknown function (DUF4062)